MKEGLYTVIDVLTSACIVALTGTVFLLVGHFKFNLW